MDVPCCHSVPTLLLLVGLPSAKGRLLSTPTPQAGIMEMSAVGVVGDVNEVLLHAVIQRVHRGGTDAGRQRCGVSTVYAWTMNVRSASRKSCRKRAVPTSVT